MTKTGQVSPINRRIYDLMMIPADWFGLRRWRKWAAPLRAKRILEIRVGTGLNMACYNRESTVFAVDPDGGMLRRAVTRAQRVRREACFCFGGTFERSGQTPFKRL